ncbi:MAG: DUF1540 domain-containing protein [Firmicutes bacterium]|nr:DUF1540 domain-containing protein [Bacillota bacterium]
MTIIQCDASECQHNDQGLCGLEEIYVGPGSVGSIPDILEASPSFQSGQLRPGYASEFEAYVDYASTHPEALFPGALCKSYSP